MIITLYDFIVNFIQQKRCKMVYTKFLLHLSQRGASFSDVSHYIIIIIEIYFYLSNFIFLFFFLIFFLTDIINDP